MERSDYICSDWKTTSTGRHATLLYSTANRSQQLTNIVNREADIQKRLVKRKRLECISDDGCTEAEIESLKIELRLNKELYIKGNESRTAKKKRHVDAFKPFKCNDCDLSHALQHTATVYNAPLNKIIIQMSSEVLTYVPDAPF